ncbi:hypothetical protein Fmac_001705 [Flemingia macrophylla]|uniref:Uncharacterized protein n=1 Tax=Flemingia macrophylla TaxID=520843 RepID=A0ABD1NKP5_9FABA
MVAHETDLVLTSKAINNMDFTTLIRQDDVIIKSASSYHPTDSTRWLDPENSFSLSHILYVAGSSRMFKSVSDYIFFL